MFRYEVLGDWLVLTINDVHQKFTFVFFEQLAEFVWLSEASLNGRQEYAIKKTNNQKLQIKIHNNDTLKDPCQPKNHERI